MANYTTRHMRYLYRLITLHSSIEENDHERVVLWSEMLKPCDILSSKSPQSLLSRGKERECGRHCVLQLGSDNAEDLIRSIHMAKYYGYSQFDLNCGCPATSNEAPYGAQLMKRADHVAYLVDKMAEACQHETPISVKCRIGTHETCDDIDQDSYENLYNFVNTVTASGVVKNVAVHARSAVLRGMSPSKNRQVPRLRYDLVHQLARDMPNLSIILNGGIERNTDYGDESSIDGIMVGRSALRNPFDFTTFLNSRTNQSAELSLESRLCCLEKYIKYATTEMMLCEKGSDLSDIFLPLALVAYSIEVESEHDLNDDMQTSVNNQVGWYLISQASKLLSTQESTKYNSVYKSASAIAASQGKLDENDEGLELLVPTPPLKKWRKQVGSQLCGKKVIQKMKSNLA